jgi:hypothetical protein
VAIILALLALGIMLYLILPLLLNVPHPTRAHTTNLQLKWHGLVDTLSGAAVAHLIFENSAGIIRFASYWLIVVDGFLALACLFLPMSNALARENRKTGLFCFLIGFLIFVQIVITPQAGAPHHYSMIFPWPLLAFAFLGKSVYTQFATKNFRYLGGVLLGSAAVCLFVVTSITARNIFAMSGPPRTITHDGLRKSILSLITSTSMASRQKYNLCGLGPAHPTPCTCTQGTAAAAAR